MARQARIQFKGAFYHLYNRGLDKRPIFLDNRDYKTFLQFLADGIPKFHIRLFAYCLMPNHYHLFLQTLENNLSLVMKEVQGRYAQYANFRHQRFGPLFQGRYKNRIVDADAYALTLVRYIHRNPVEAGLGSHPQEYSWSSYLSYVGKLPKWKWLDTAWILQQLHGEPSEAVRLFSEFHQKKPTELEQYKLENIKKILERKNPSGDGSRGTRPQ